MKLLISIHWALLEKIISAVSWELHKHGRGDGTINLLGRMAERLCANNEMADFFVFLLIIWLSA